MIVLDDVSMLYGDGNTHALDHVSLTIEDGEFVFIVGDSGVQTCALPILFL